MEPEEVSVLDDCAEFEDCASDEETWSWLEDAYYFLQLIEKVVFFLLFIGLFGALQVENPAFFATK